MKQSVFPGWESYFTASWSLKKLLQNGIQKSIERQFIFSAPPAKHFSTALLHIVCYAKAMQYKFPSSQTISSFDTLLAPFIKIDNLQENDIKLCLQNFVFLLNMTDKGIPLNLERDKTCPQTFATANVILDGTIQPFTYGECQTEIDMLNKTLDAVMKEGDAEGVPFEFPTFTVPQIESIPDEEQDDSMKNIEKLHYEMYTSPACKKCPPVKDFMALSHIDGKEINIDTDKGFDTAAEKGVFMTPTVIFFNESNEEVARAHTVNELESVFLM